MAHAIAKTAAGADAMAFTGATPWHGLGQRLTEGATLDQWTQAAGFDWNALTATPEFLRADGTRGSFDDKRVIYRSDTGAPLSVMGAGYQIVQPREVMGFFQSLIEGHGMKMHTAGVLDGGRRLWALCKNGHAGEIVKGDKVRQFLMLATSLDGSTPTVATWTQVRVVCANTIAIALRDSKTKARMSKKQGGAASAVRVSHKSAFDAEAVKAAMGLADTAWNQFAEDAAKLVDTPVSLGEARDVLRGIFGEPVSTKRKPSEAPAATLAPVGAPAAAPAGAVAAAGDLAALLASPYVPKVDAAAEAREDLARLLAKGDTREQKSVARCLALFAGEGRGANHAGVTGTAWGLLNAVTEHVDHEMGRTRDTGLTSAWFGRGNAFKQDALQSLLTL